jgi:hypothetical protein
MRLAVAFLSLAFAASADAVVLSRTALKCEGAAASALRQCLRTVGAATRACYLDTGAACPANDPALARAIGRLEARIASRCPTDQSVQAVGWGPLLGTTALVDRLREACLAAHASLAARTFGGPHGAVVSSADEATHRCLGKAHEAATTLLGTGVKTASACIRREHRGATCDAAATAAKLAAAEARATAKAGAACPDLATPIGLDVPAYVAKARAQVDCLAATSHRDGGPLTLSCGPRDAVPVPQRGQWVQVVLDQASTGTRCGNGSDYAFWMRLAPPGGRLDHVAIDLQGGGVCVFEADCSGVPASLFTATDDGQPNTGYLSSDPAVNPFHDWTMIYLPYCTQDVHFGNGTTSAFTSLTVHRFGGRNVRASLAHLRDALWAALDLASPSGFRPDELTVMFAGESAGAFGVQYNYHWLLDDLGWTRTTAVPDSGLSLDNGQPIGVAALGIIAQSPAPPLGWNTRPIQAPYCLSTTCAVGPVLQTATVPRLKAVPEQQFLNVSNQVDNTQVNTTFFSSVAAWTNALRTSYCALQGTAGIRYFLPASASNVHTMLRSNARFTGLLADGVSPRQFLADAFADPDAVVDRVEEGTLTTAIPGVLPFACPVD